VALLAVLLVGMPLIKLDINLARHHRYLDFV